MTNPGKYILLSLVKGRLKFALEATSQRLSDVYPEQYAKRNSLWLLRAVANGKLRGSLLNRSLYLFLAFRAYNVAAPRILAEVWLSSRKLRDSFADPAPRQWGNLVFTKNAKGIEVADGRKTIMLYFDRMPKLVIFTLFLSNLMHYKWVSERLEGLETEPNISTISRISDELATEVYALITQNLATGHILRKYNFVQRYIKDNSARLSKTSDFGDADVLALWQLVLREGADVGMKLYRKCHKSAENFLQRWDDGLTISALEDGQEIGTHADRKFSFDAARPTESVTERCMLALCDADSFSDQTIELIDAIDRTQFNVLTGPQRDLIDHLLVFPQLTSHLDLSRVRAHVFGAHQSKFESYLKQTDRSNVQDALREKLASLSYQSVNDRLEKSLRDLETGLWAVAHVLFENENPTGFDFLIALSQDTGFLERADVKKRLSMIASTDGLSDAERSQAGLSLLTAHAHRMFKRAGRSRKGFEVELIHDPLKAHDAEIIADAYHGQLNELQRRAQRLFVTLSNANFEADVSLFYDTFTDAYKVRIT
jgi:hypothetical protein